MDALDPLEFQDDIEVALPEVVCSWPAEVSETDEPDESTTPSPSRVAPLPPIGSPSSPSPPKPASDSNGSSPTSRRRKYSAVVSLFLRPQASTTHDPPEDQEQDETPPILAALEAVSLDPQRRCNGGVQRDLDSFHFSVSSESSSALPMYPSHPSPPSPDRGPQAARPRGRAHSATAGFASPLDLRTASTVSEDPASRTSPGTSPSSPSRGHRRATHRGVYALTAIDRADRATPHPRSTGSCEDRGHTGEQWPHAIEAVGVGSLSGSGVSSGAPSPPRSVDLATRLVSPRLPPIAAGSCTRSPRKSPSRCADVHKAECVACGRVRDGEPSLQLDAVRTVHRSCFRCASCLEPLTLANFHSTTSAGSSRHGFTCTTHHVANLREAMT